VHDRLERPGRSGGVEDQDRVVGLGRQVRIRGARLAHLVEQVECHSPNSVLAPRLTAAAGDPGRQLSGAVGERGAVDERAHPGGLEHAGLLVGGETRVQGHADGAGLEQAKSMAPTTAVVHQQTDSRAPLHAEPDQQRWPSGWPSRRPHGRSATARR
jgi:hypothetical protein